MSKYAVFADEIHQSNKLLNTHFDYFLKLFGLSSATESDLCLHIYDFNPNTVLPPELCISMRHYLFEFSQVLFHVIRYKTISLKFEKQKNTFFIGFFAKKYLTSTSRKRYYQWKTYIASLEKLASVANNYFQLKLQYEKINKSSSWSIL